MYYKYDLLLIKIHDTDSVRKAHAAADLSGNIMKSLEKFKSRKSLHIEGGEQVGRAKARRRLQAMNAKRSSVAHP